MFGVAQRHGRGLLILTAVAAMALSACGGGSLTPAPSGSGGSLPSGQVAATGNQTGDKGPSLSGAAGALANLSSFKFSMTQAGTDYVNQLADLTGSASALAGSVTFSGTVILKPEKAVDVTTTGLHVISVGGFDYMDVGNQGAFVKTTPVTTSVSDAFVPAQLYTTVRASGYSNIGSETKNGVPSDHYQAGASALAEFGSVSGVKNATWSADIWIAKDGGYPVSIGIIARATDGSVPYQTSFDLTNINDASNKVTAPDNVMGA